MRVVQPVQMDGEDSVVQVGVEEEEHDGCSTLVQASRDAEVGSVEVEPLRSAECCSAPAAVVILEADPKLLNELCSGDGSVERPRRRGGQGVFGAPLSHLRSGVDVLIGISDAGCGTQAMHKEEPRSYLFELDLHDLSGVHLLKAEVVVDASLQSSLARHDIQLGLPSLESAG